MGRAPKKQKPKKNLRIFEEDADADPADAEGELPKDEAGRRKIKRQYEDLLGIRIESSKPHPQPRAHQQDHRRRLLHLRRVQEGLPQHRRGTRRRPRQRPQRLRHLRQDQGQGQAVRRLSRAQRLLGSRVANRLHNPLMLRDALRGSSARAGLSLSPNYCAVRPENRTRLAACGGPMNPTGWKPVPPVAPASSRWRFVGRRREAPSRSMP